MLFYNFKNYEEFKERFGIIEHGNGVKSRKNKILLSLYKDKTWFKRYINFLSWRSAYNAYDIFYIRYERIDRKSDSQARVNLVRTRRIKYFYSNLEESFDYVERNIDRALYFTELTSLKQYIYDMLEDTVNFKKNQIHGLLLNGHRFFSDKFETDKELGICEDGTVNAIRYKNVENRRVFKMKAGKMINHLMSCNRFTDDLPEQIKRWFSEEFVGEWIEYANRILNPAECTLHVDDDFESIYSYRRYAGGNFHSCMVDDGQWTFYRDSVKAKAAYTTNDEGKILARCIIYTEVHEFGSDKIWRLAERQYSMDSNLGLQRQLIRKLIDGGYIDGFKSVGASCHDASAFESNDGTALDDKEFWIDCSLENGDTLSYQDSFKWYDESSHKAYNTGEDDKDCLADTNSTYYTPDEHEGEVWSDFNDEWISEDDSYYVDTRNDHLRCDQCVEAKHNGIYQYCAKCDCIEIDCTWYYAGLDAEDYEDYGICRCPECDVYFLKKDGCYSDLLDLWFCDSSCLENAESNEHERLGDKWSDHDDRWLDCDEAIKALEYDKWFNSYFTTWLSIDSFNSLVEDCGATVYCGEYYIDNILADGEPAHLGCSGRKSA